MRAETGRGDTDLAAAGRLLAEPARARMLLALGDGRALPASMLAAEAGVARSTASEHLGALLAGGFLAVEPQDRHRYYRLAGPEVGRLIEVLAALAPPAPIRSLREGTRAAAVRAARSCYDHLAGRLGVLLLESLLDAGHVIGGDGRHEPARAVKDRLSAPGRDVDYRLTPSGLAHLEKAGFVPVATGRDGAAGLRYCVDWTEQRHHLAGELGRSLRSGMLDRGWIVRAERSRAVHVTDRGLAALQRWFGLAWNPG